MQDKQPKYAKSKKGQEGRKVCLAVVLAVLMAAAAASAQVASHAPTGAAAAPPAGPGLDQPVAKVNSAVLTQRDLLREMYALFPYARQHGGSVPKALEPEMRKGALQMIIFEELVYQEALRRKMVISAATIAGAETKFRKQFQTPDKFQEYLKFECKGSKQVLRERIRRSLLIDGLLKAEVNDRSVVSLAEARSFYDKNPKQFSHGETLSIQTISIMPPQKAAADIQAEAKKKAEKAWKDGKATKSYKEFGLLAEKVSDDDWHVNMGDRKTVEAATLPPPLVDAAHKMKTGDVSDLLQFGTSYTFFRLNGRTPAGKVPFDEVKGKLKSDLQNAKAEQLRSGLDKRLRQTAKVQEL